MIQINKEEYRATGGNAALLKDYHRKSDSLAQWQINFSKYDKQTYAFDHIGIGNHGIFSGADYYPQVGSYDFRYKSVECGKNDKVIVEFDTYPQADSVVFKDKYGVTYPISLNDNVLSFTGVSKADTNFIYAYRGDKKIGKLFLNTYQQKTYKVVFVRVNGAAKKLNEKEITKCLNKVYNQCAVSFEISKDEITIDDLTSFSHGGSGILSVYNDDQKKVLKAYDNKMQDNTYYLFYVDGVTDKKDGNGTLVSGYMPRGYNAGFIYDGGSERTIAHELGHGIAGLEHVFENSSNSGKTANLMDYASGEELWHFQWDQIQDPSRVWMKWNKDEGEGENVEQQEAWACIPEDKEGFQYITKKMKDGYLTYICEEKEQNSYFAELLSIFLLRPCVSEIAFPKRNSLVFVCSTAMETGEYHGSSIYYVRTKIDDYKQLLTGLQRPVPLQKYVYEEDANGGWKFKYGNYFNGADKQRIKQHLDDKDITENINDYSFAVVITIYLSQVFESYGKNTILLSNNKKVIKRYEVNNIEALKKVGVLFTLGHEFFIHHNAIKGIMNNDYQSFIHDCGPNGGDWDHKDYINGKNALMLRYIKELKDFFQEHTEYEISPSDVDLVKEIHDFKYRHLKTK